jgi:hypothetical protein
MLRQKLEAEKTKLAQRLSQLQGADNVSDLYRSQACAAPTAVCSERFALK